MKNKIMTSICISLAYTSSVNLVAAQSLDALSEYSVITSGDFSSNSDIEGKTLLGGNFSGSSAVNFGTELRDLDSADFSVRVAGDIGFGNPIQINAGSIELGGNVGADQNGSRGINFNGGGSLVSNPGVAYDDVFTQLSLASTALAALPANSSIELPGSQPSAVVFNSTPTNGLSVFSIGAAELLSNQNAQQFSLNSTQGETIVVNVSGTNVNFTNGNFVSAFTTDEFRERVVWNFYQAETINFGGNAFQGQILAPGAVVTTRGVIDGSIFAESLHTTSEVHLPTFNGNDPFDTPEPDLPPTITVPEPSSTALLGLGALALFIRRKR